MKYEGEWKNGKQHGKGRITNPKGKVEEFEWYEGKKIQEDGSVKDFSKIIRKDSRIMKSVTSKSSIQVKYRTKQ